MKWLKKMWQVLVARCSGTWIYKNSPLLDETIDVLIDKKEENYLLSYIKVHKLSSKHITKILQSERESDLIQAILRIYVLDETQQQILAEKNNVILMETYLSPQGFWEPQRALSPKAEFTYLSMMIKSRSMMGIELFKIYVDNQRKTIMTDDILTLCLQNDCFASRYLLKRAYLSDTQEEYLINNASFELLSEYVENKQFYQEQAQILLVEKYYSLAKIHQEEYGLRPKAQVQYQQKRREEIQILHPEGVVP